ncbi:hypothetical protein [Limosilactobacillus fermentum]|uniref:hypothetical protein n=1 Tax=Limosilactobacillus fermentum TaxID=1613 RepID=UPI0021A706CB|nr:hypothetical protein [Limosilactobacillus fermentum]
MREVPDELYYEAAKKVFASKRWQEDNKYFADEMVKAYLKNQGLGPDNSSISEEQLANARTIREICFNVSKAVAPSVIAATFEAIAEAGFTSLRPRNENDKD